MKNFIIYLLLIFPISFFPQQASSYFPSSVGYLWNYKVVPLDSLNNPVIQLEYFRKDTFALVSNYKGRLANFIFSKEGSSQLIHSQPYTDTNYYSLEGTNAFEYLSSPEIEEFLAGLDSLGLDPNFNFVNFFRSLKNWYSVYRFASNTNVNYTLLQKDTSFSNFNIRFRYSATRNADQSLNTAIGTFICKKFTTKWDFSYLLGPIAVPLFSIDDTIWIAPERWIVKAYQPSKHVDLSILGIPPFNILGRKLDIIEQIVNVNDSNISINDFVLYQNYPNPFNPSTIISWQSPISGYLTIKLFDLLGRELETIVEGYYEAGYNSKLYIVNSPQDASHKLSTGVYFYQIKVGDYIQTKKMMILK